MKTFILAFTLILSSNIGYTQTAEELYDQSLSEIRNKNYDKAIELIDLFIESYPDFENIHMIYLNRASAKSLNGDQEGAIADYTTAFEKDSTYAEALRQRGFTKKIMGNYKEALIDYNLSLEIDSNLSRSYINIGIVLDSLGRKTESCAYYERALILGLAPASGLLRDCNPVSKVILKYDYKLLEDKTDDETYGFTVENPIKCGHGPSGQRAYLDLLRDGKGKPVSYKRIGSSGFYESENGMMGMAAVDGYQVKYRNSKGRKKKVVLYISFYDYKQPKIPVGFYSIEDWK